MRVGDRQPTQSALGRLLGCAPALQHLQDGLDRPVLLVAQFPLNARSHVPGLQGLMNLILGRLQLRSTLLYESHQFYPFFAFVDDRRDRSGKPSTDNELRPCSCKASHAEFSTDEQPATRARQELLFCERSKNRSARQRLQPKQPLGLQRRQPEARHFSVFFANSMQQRLDRRGRCRQPRRRRAHQKPRSGEKEP